MTSLYEILKSAKCGAGAAQDFHTAIMAQKMPFAKGSGAEHEYTGTVPVAFTANGQPLLDYLISGNTVQSGTPTPDSPIQPQGTGERTGNLCDESAIQQGYYGALGSYSVFTADTKYRCFKLDLPAGIYTLNISAEEDMYILRCSNSVDGAITVYSAPPYTFTLSADATIYVSWRNTDTTNSFTNMKVMLNTGSSPLPHEPYGIKIPISSTSTTTPVYLGEVETTRKVKKLVLTGEEETWSQHQTLTSWFMLNINTLESNTIVSNIEICSHYKPSTGTPASIANGEILVNFQDGNKRIIIRDTTYSTIDNFKTYLAQQYAAGTPVCVWYVLATAETAVVNEPLMKIGSYADSISMEQAGVEIPTARGTNTLDVLTDVKPSEVYIKYKE